MLSCTTGQIYICPAACSASHHFVIAPSSAAHIKARRTLTCAASWVAGLKRCLAAVHVHVIVQVYTSLEPKAHFLQLADQGAGLKEAWAAFRSMQDAISVLNWYYALNGVSILLLIAR